MFRCGSISSTGSVREGFKVEKKECVEMVQFV